MRHILTIPHFIPASDNKLTGCHWSVKNKLKKADAETIYWMMRNERIPTALQKRRVEVLIMCKPKGRIPDPTNFAKSVLDALVKCRMIIDDSQRWCEYVTPEIRRGTKESWGTRITLTDVEDGMKDFWLIFLKDPATGVVHCTGYGHNAVGDYRGNPYFIGMKKISVDMAALENAQKAGRA